MTNRTLRIAITIIALLHFSPIANAQLPPEAQARLYELNIKDAVEAGDLRSALATIDKYKKLGKDHFPPAALVTEAKLSVALGTATRGLKALDRYFKEVKSDHPDYDEALRFYQVLQQIDAAAKEERRKEQARLAAERKRQQEIEARERKAREKREQERQAKLAREEETRLIKTDVKLQEAVDNKDFELFLRAVRAGAPLNGKVKSRKHRLPFIQSRRMIQGTYFGAFLAGRFGSKDFAKRYETLIAAGGDVNGVAEYEKNYGTPERTVITNLVLVMRAFMDGRLEESHLTNAAQQNRYANPVAVFKKRNKEDKKRERFYDGSALHALHFIYDMRKISANFARLTKAFDILAAHAGKRFNGQTLEQRDYFGGTPLEQLIGLIAYRNLGVNLKPEELKGLIAYIQHLKDHYPVKARFHYNYYRLFTNLPYPDIDPKVVRTPANDDEKAKAYEAFSQGDCIANALQTNMGPKSTLALVNSLYEPGTPLGCSGKFNPFAAKRYQASSQIALLNSLEKIGGKPDATNLQNGLANLRFKKSSFALFQWYFDRGGHILPPGTGNKKGCNRFVPPFSVYESRKALEMLEGAGISILEACGKTTPLHYIGRSAAPEVLRWLLDKRIKLPFRKCSNYIGYITNRGSFQNGIWDAARLDRLRQQIKLLKKLGQDINKPHCTTDKRHPHLKSSEEYPRLPVFEPAHLLLKNLKAKQLRRSYFKETELASAKRLLTLMLEEGAKLNRKQDLSYGYRVYDQRTKKNVTATGEHDMISFGKTYFNIDLSTWKKIKRRR